MNSWFLGRWVWAVVIGVVALVLLAGCAPSSGGEVAVATVALAANGATATKGKAAAAETATPITETEEAPPTSKPQPKPTAAPPTATAELPTPTPRSAFVRLPPLDRNLPKDILKETRYFGGGGGGPSNCADLYGYDSDFNHLPTHIAFMDPEYDLDWLDSSYVITCGWFPSKPVVVTLSSREGILDSWDRTADEFGSVAESVGVTIQYQPGTYEISFVGENNSGVISEVSHTLNVVAPARPRLYHFHNDKKEDMGEIMLAGFQPGEKVRIIVYEDHQHLSYTFKFLGWTTVQMDGEGMLPVYTGIFGDESNPIGFAAVGEVSGEAESVWAFTSGGLMRNFESTVYVPEMDSNTGTNCPGTLPTRLAIGSKARVLADRLSVREGPAADYATVFGTTISQGRTVTILDGPACSDGMVWWKGETGVITLTNGQQHNIVGWMAEGSEGEWFLEPVE